MVNTTFISTEDMIKRLQNLKGKTKLKLYRNISNYYIEMKDKSFQTYDQDPFSKNAQDISKIYHEVLLLMKFLQTKPDIKNMNIIYYDLYNTVIKVRDENKNLDNQYENDYNDYIVTNSYITPNHYIKTKDRDKSLLGVEV